MTENNNNLDTSPDAEINTEALMAQIREQIAARRATLPAVDLAEDSPAGGHLPADFYEHLHNARRLHNQIQPPILVTETNVPLLGPLLQFFRRKLHELVIFYVQQVAANQVRVNAHLLQALTILGQEVERQAERADDNQAAPPANL